MNEKCEHTPGPWEVWGGTRIVTSNPPARNIAEVSGRSPDEGQANARLIAAAPDLLDACKAVIGAPHSIPNPDYFNEHRERMTAAIAKAEGRSR